MDYFNERTVSAFTDELEKIGGALSFLSKGFKNLSSLGRRSWGQHRDLATKIYQRGAKKGGTWGGISGLARSPYGSSAAAAGTLGAAGYGGYKAVTGNPQQQRY
jgi:hypothetical protein